MSSPWEGLLLVDKPEGPTSHDVVAQLRRVTGSPRVGHTGTLDPPASGLLLLLFGAATRLAGYVPSAPKDYRGSFRLGVRTGTDDLQGTVIARHDGPPPSDAEVRSAATRLVGRSMQIPPAVSARRVQGERLHRAARRGVTLDAPATPVEVFRFEIASTPEPTVWTFDASVSSGTYIRGLVRDLGADLGCGAAVAALRRTRIGPLDVAEAVAPGDDLGPLSRAVVPLDAMPIVGERLTLTDEESGAFRHGRRIDRAGLEGTVAVRDPRGALLGIGGIVAGCLEPRVVLVRRSPAASVAAGGDAVIPSGRSSS